VKLSLFTIGHSNRRFEEFAGLSTGAGLTLHGSEFLSPILRHLSLVAASTAIAVAARVPLGVV